MTPTGLAHFRHLSSEAPDSLHIGISLHEIRERGNDIARATKGRNYLIALRYLSR